MMNSFSNKITASLLSLRIRQRILLSFFAFALIIIASYFFNFYQQKDVENLTHEIILDRIPLIREIQNVIIELEQQSTTLSLYLLSDENIYVYKLHRTNKDLKNKLNIIQEKIESHVEHVEHHIELNNKWLLFENKLMHLLELVNDPIRRFPGITAASNKLLPLNQQFNSLLEQIANELKDENHQDNNINALFHSLYDTRFKWNRLINSFRLLMSTHSPSSVSSVKDYIGDINKQFIHLKEKFQKTGKFAEFNSQDINEMQQILKQYIINVNEVARLIENNSWRADTVYYNSNVLPVLTEIKVILYNIVENEIARANDYGSKLIRANSFSRTVMFTLSILALIFGMVIVIKLSHHITERLNILMLATHKATAGNLDVEFELIGNDELTELGHDFLIMTKTLKHKSRELEAQKVALDQHDIVSIADPAGKITYVNQKFCDISGYKSTELIGRSHNVVNSGYHDKNFWRDLWHTIGHGRVWHGEVRNRKKDGSYYWVNTTIVPFSDENNKPYQYVSMRTDITATKQSESELKELNIKLEERVVERTQAVETAMRGLEHALQDVDREKQAIQAIVSGTTIASGKDFYQSLVKNTAKALNMEYAILATYRDINSTNCHVLSMWAIDRPGEQFDYDLIGTPCEHVAGKKSLIVENSVAQKYPDDLMLKEIQVESYIGIPFFDSVGKPLGHLLVMGKKPINNSIHHQELVEIFATRAGAELERERINKLLKLRLEQQASAAQLGQLALADTDINNLFATVSFVVASSLNVEFSKILQYRENNNDFLLIAGVGWEDGLLGNAVIPNHNHSQAGYTLDHDDVVVVNDFSTETRFEEPKLLKDHDIRSGMSTTIADTKEPYGIISIHSKEHRTFTEDDARYLDSVSRILTMALARFKAKEAVEHELQTQHIISELLQLSLMQHSLNEQLSKALNIIFSSNTFNEKSKACIMLLDEHSQNLKLASQQGFSLPIAEQFNEVPLKLFFNNKAKIKQQVVSSQGDRNKLNIKFDSAADYTEYSIPIKIGSKILGILNLYMDPTYTHKKQHDEFYIAVANTLAGIIERKNVENSLAEAYRHKSEFLANMSHELRTPLNSIIGFSKTMLKGIDGPTTEDQDESLSYIHRSGQHLLSLIGDILDMSKLEAKRMELYYSDVNMSLLMKDIVKTIGVLAKEKSLTIKVDIEKDLPLIPCDETRTKQVLLNIASNAVKFTETGGINFNLSILTKENTVLPQDIEKLVEKSDIPFLLISAKDTGIGIAKEDIHKIFEEFRQADNSSTRKHSGTGLGMTISKRLVEMHGGTMWLESTIGKGSSFYFILPMERDLVPQLLSESENE